MVSTFWISTWLVVVVVVLCDIAPRAVAWVASTGTTISATSTTFTTSTGTTTPTQSTDPIANQPRQSNNPMDPHRHVRLGEQPESLPKKKGKPYQILSSKEIYEQIKVLQKTYPEFLRVTTSQERYGLPSAGTADDCPFLNDDDGNLSPGCPNWILEIQDYTVHPVDSDSSNELPAVMWSGCLHGDERVGPTATMEAVALLLEAAQCESTVSTSCRVQLKKERGIQDAHRKWLARLVTTRKIVVVPTSNALGYYQNRREEGTVDPNRDFPYDLDDKTQCMQTIAGRTLNELYRENLFQLALTFHAGMEVVAYEWGAPTYLHHFSPDHMAQDAIASAYSNYGGGWSKSKPYDYGTMNDLVYYVRGGMEDWAYAGSFDPERVVSCEPTTFGGYPKEKTVYNKSTLRVFNMLVETSDRKTPASSNLGTSWDVLSGDTTHNGHISRNIRLALLSAELVEPYVSVVAINELVLADDLPPRRSREGRTCQRQPFLIAKDAKDIEIQFSVGGAMTIDQVSLWWTKWDNIPEDELDCLSQPFIMDGFKGEIIGAKNGTGYFSPKGSHPRPSSQSGETSSGSVFAGRATLGPIFKGRISLPRKGLKPWDKLVVIASARVDQQWATTRSNVRPNVGPQSHIVNARTNEDWYHESNGKRIRGRLDWFSAPLTVVIGDFAEGVGTHGGGSLVKTVEMNPRIPEVKSGGLKPKSAQEEQLWFPVNMWYAGAILLLVAVVVGLLCCCRIERRRRARRQKALNGNYNQDDTFRFGADPYSDEYLDGDEEDEESEDEDEEEEAGMELPALA